MHISCTDVDERLAYVKRVQVGDGSSLVVVYVQVVTLENVMYPIVVLARMAFGCIVNTDGRPCWSQPECTQVA